MTYNRLCPDILNSAGITAFLCTSGTKLRTLVITYCLARTVNEILSFTPEIEQLVLFNVADTKDLFMWLAGTETQGLRCRNLNALWAHSLSPDYEKALGPCMT